MRIIGIMVLVVGLALLGFGISATDLFREKMTRQATGQYSSNTMWYIIGGLVLTVGGAALTRYKD